MKKIQLSVFVLLAMVGAAVMSFTTGNTIKTDQWYGQTSDAVPPYDETYPLTLTQVNADCASSTQHICAVELDGNGNLVATRKSTHNFTP